MWERELLLTSFLSWKRYSSKEWKRVEDGAKKLGDKAIATYYVQRWRQNQKLEAQRTKKKIETIYKRKNDRILLSHFMQWFAYSQCRGKRIRKTRKLWKQWISFIYQQQEDRRSLKLLLKSIQMSRKAYVVTHWMKAKLLSQQEQIRNTKNMGKIQPKLLYTLSLWINHSPKLFVKFCFESVSNH